MMSDDLKKACSELAEHRQRLLAVLRLIHFSPGVELHHAVATVASDLHATARLLEGATAQTTLPLNAARKKGE